MCLCLLVFERDGEITPELDGWSLPFAAGPEMIPVLVDMHPAMAVCFFRVVRSSWHQALLLQPQKTCYCGELSLAEIPAWHAAAPVPASAFLPANRLTLLYHEGFHILTIKNRSEFFTRMQKLPEQALVVENLAELRGGTWSVQASYSFEE